MTNVFESQCRRSVIVVQRATDYENWLIVERVPCTNVRVLFANKYEKL